MILERAEAWHVRDTHTDAQYLVQFWDTHQERHGRRRMAVAVFRQNPTFPSNYHLIQRTRVWPIPSLSCDGPEVATYVVSEVTWEILDDYVPEKDLDVSLESVENLGEIHLTHNLFKAP